MFRSAASFRREFLETHARQSDEEFVVACGMSQQFADDVVRVRIAIANLANVDREFVRAGDTFERDLSYLDFWGSLDSMMVLHELEKCLDTRISNEQGNRIRNPEAAPGLTVAEFVNDVIRAVRQGAG